MSTIYLSEAANPILTAYLENLGHELISLCPSPHVDGALASHPDIYMCKMGAGKDTFLFRGDPECLKPEYPFNAKYNAVCIGNHFIHNLSYTGQALLDAAKSMGKILIPVKQGYTKCNMVVISDDAAITSDLGIVTALSDCPIDLLVIAPGHVKLTGFPYGFLGGASGRIGNEIVFHGDLSSHPDFAKISEFIAKHNLKLTYFNEFELEDIGSIIEA